MISPIEAMIKFVEGLANDKLKEAPIELRSMTTRQIYCVYLTA
jgi:hypothetical protein